MKKKQRTPRLHFKLERWMDYGPTIAAAFAAREEDMVNSPTHKHRNGNVNVNGSGGGGGGGSGGDDDGFNTTNDVSALRKIILGCMRNARDFALIAGREQQDSATTIAAIAGSGGGGMVASGRYDAELHRDARIPAGSGNMGYHQAFSAESGERRRLSRSGKGVPGDSSDQGSEEESSRDRDDVEPARASKGPPAVAPPVVDLLG
jgi:hypothetical protein